MPSERHSWLELLKIFLFNSPDCWVSRMRILDTAWLQIRLVFIFTLEACMDFDNPRKQADPMPDTSNRLGALTLRGPSRESPCNRTQASRSLMPQPSRDARAYVATLSSGWAEVKTAITELLPLNVILLPFPACTSTVKCLLRSRHRFCCDRTRSLSFSGKVFVWTLKKWRKILSPNKANLLVRP